MKRILLAACALLPARYAMGQEWLPQSPVSFYETTADLRQLAASLDGPQPGLDEAPLDDPFDGPPERPYGYGREPGNTSPAEYDGLVRDTAYFFGYQFIIIGVLYVMPESISSWSDEQKEKYTFEKWKHNVSNPRWDPDEWYINYILHPYWGMTYYTRGRERGLSEYGSFWYSFGLSCLYEFGLEALFEPASIQDIIFTPALGSLFGWWVEDTRREIKSQSEYSGWDKTILIATDPLGTLNTMVDDLFGNNVESELELRSFYRSPAITESEQLSLGEFYDSRRSPVVADYLGLELTLHWR